MTVYIFKNVSTTLKTTKCENTDFKALPLDRVEGLGPGCDVVVTVGPVCVVVSVGPV